MPVKSYRLTLLLHQELHHVLLDVGHDIPHYGQIRLSVDDARQGFKPTGECCT